MTSVISLPRIFEYFKDEIKVFEKGDNAYKSKNVRSVLYDGSLHVLRGTVAASMKNKTYDVEIDLNDKGQIQGVECNCPRGQVKCHHIAALLIHAHYNISVTDRACKWSVKKEELNQTVQTVDEMFGSSSNDYDATSSTMSDEKRQQLFKDLFESSGLHTGISWLLSPEVPDSALLLHNLESTLLSQEMKEAADKVSFLLEKVRVNAEVISRIEQATIGQSKNSLWLVVKRFLITASNVGAVLRACNSGKYSESLFNTLLGAYDLDGVKAIKWGRENEATARKAFEDHFSVKVRECGIFLHESGLLGASPDGLIDDEIVLQIKCPYKWRNCPDIEVALMEAKKSDIVRIENGTYVVNEKNDWYHQIQTQLFILNKKEARLFIWTPKGFFCAPIQRNETWRENIQKLITFFCGPFLNRILSQHCQ